ncbi:MAG: zinc-ribbon domain-containing protein [Thermoleophilia bacterium]|nr:zinc-ribbon domain-containing protein [Thermoleophilia bacterium]
MAFCANCGNPLGEDAKFCAKCGQPVGQAAVTAEAAAAEASPDRAAALVAPEPPAAPLAPEPSTTPSAVAPAPPPPPTPAQAYAQAPPPPPPAFAQAPAGGTPYAQAPYGQPPRRRSLKWLWIGLAALAVIVAIVCVLVFVVFDGDGGGGASEPEKVVTKLFDAMEDGDIDTVFEVMDPEMLGSEFGEEFIDLAKEAMRDEMFSEGSFKFSDLKMETKETGEDTATVRILEGKVTMTDKDGVSETSDVSDADEPVEFYLVKRDGKWYVDPSSMDW